MTTSPSAPPLLHPVLDDGEAGEGLGEAILNDRQRLAVLLQAACLLSHLARAGFRLRDGWKAARVNGEGALFVSAIEAGRSREPIQVLLCALANQLFDGEPVGRGQARRAARSLLDLWQQTLAAVPPDEALQQLFDAAPFLWQPRYGLQRRALVAERRQGEGGRCCVAGPAGFQRRALALAGSRRELEELMASDRCRELWYGEAGSRGAPALAAAGRWRQAVAAWGENPPQTAEERRLYARALFCIGKFERAGSVLEGDSRRAAALLRVQCDSQLGRLRPARRGLRELEAGRLTTAETLELAPTAIRISANAGDRDAVRAWRSKVLRAGRGSERARARLLAALASWDLEERDALSEHLAAARKTAAESRVEWLLHRVEALAASLDADGRTAVHHLHRALALGRRTLLPFERGRLWNELGVARALADDLPGAERALRHAVHLLGRCDGHLHRVLALPNLAEVRIRRGRLEGVAEILERSRRENELAGNVRGLVEDGTLLARFELARGDGEAALRHCRETMEMLDDVGAEWKRDELRVLAARALGWLGRPGGAALELEGVEPEATALLEPEERPALWGLAGLVEPAVEVAATSGLDALWLGMLEQRPLRSADWSALEELEPYRSARLVFDFVQLQPGSVPATWLDRAIATLRRLDLRALAGRLEAERRGPWRALRLYLQRRPQEGDGLAELFRGAGYGEIRLLWLPPEGSAEAELVLVGGPGGAEELEVPIERGRLLLRADRIDDVLRALIACAGRDFSPPPSSSPAGPAVRGIVGESSALQATLERLARVAPQEVPVLVLGESGTGKELVAREVHRQSPRRRHPFIPLNCAALPESLLLSDLFGHARGAFTGADRERQGIFEAASGGTVFLDEIGDLPPSAQGTFLRVLQEGEVRRVGETRPRKVNVRLVTATHHDLERMVEEGTFRTDLYYRLRVATLELPPLRDRGTDVLLLADTFLREKGGGDRPVRLTEAARRRLLGHPWPGNVRQLHSVLEVALALAGDGPIDEEHLDLPTTEQRASTYQKEVDRLRRRLIEEALTTEAGNQAAAARRLGLTRQALSYLVRQLGVAKPKR